MFGRMSRISSRGKSGEAAARDWTAHALGSKNYEGKGYIQLEEDRGG